MNIQNFEAARITLFRLLEKRGYTIISVEVINRNRYYLVKATPHNFMIMFKREPFNDYGRMLKNTSEEGDSINVEDLQTAKQFEVIKIFSVFPKTIYSIDLFDFLVGSIRWTNKEGKPVRSIPMSLYTKELDL